MRENGRIKTEDGTPDGKPVLDENGEPVRIPGLLKHVKAIGWYVEEYGIAQVSMNLTNIEETPLHAAFDASSQAANKRGLRVTGSEIVGMVPKKCLVDAGRYFLRKQKWSEGASEEELIDIAIRSMGLSELKPFDPREKIIEFKMESAASKKSLLKMDLRQFCNETLSDSPAPGGGSVAALMGALGASLGFRKWPTACEMVRLANGGVLLAVERPSSAAERRKPARGESPLERDHTTG